MTKVLEKGRFQFGHYELANEVHGDSGIPCVLLDGILIGPVVPPAERRRQLTMPTLVIGHRGDRRHTHRDAAELAKEIPNARLLETRWIGELRVRPDGLWPKIRVFPGAG